MKKLILFFIVAVSSLPLLSTDIKPDKYFYRGNQISKKTFDYCFQKLAKYIFIDSKGKFYNVMSVGAEGEKIQDVALSKKIGIAGELYGKVIGFERDMVIFRVSKETITYYQVPIYDAMSNIGAGKAAMRTKQKSETDSESIAVKNIKNKDQMLTNSAHTLYVTLSGSKMTQYGNLPLWDIITPVSESEFKAYLNEGGILTRAKREKKYTDCSKCNAKGTIENPEFSRKKMNMMYITCDQCKGAKHKITYIYTLSELE